jgi:histidinol-phosphatase (PHP family)
LCGVRWSYHVHTLYSDGNSTIEEHCKAACSLGLEELGFSDHFTLKPDGSMCRWSMDPKRFPEYVAEVLAAKEAYAGRLNVRLGIEADYFPETASHTKDILSGYPLDYVICSVHFVDGVGIDESTKIWENAPQKDRDELFRRYWELIRQMAESRLGSIAAHLDLPKKYGYQAEVNLTAEVEAALDALAEHDWLVELNTSGWHKPCGEQYPSLDILKGLRRRGIPVILSSDAHKAAYLTRDFDRGQEMLSAVGLEPSGLPIERAQGPEEPGPSEASRQVSTKAEAQSELR